MKAFRSVHVLVDNGHDEQEERKLLGLSLGRRHLELLALIFTYPLLHNREMAALLDLEVSSIERYLGDLSWRGCAHGMRNEIV
jgi:hypothetical protein